MARKLFRARLLGELIGLTSSILRLARVRTYTFVLASAVLLTACGADPTAGPTASKSGSATPSASAPPSASATPSATPTPTATPEPAAPVTVTTPNGLHSFTLPAGWSAAEAEPWPILEHDIGSVSPAAFTIMDASGTPVAEFHSGISADGAAIGSSPGHVLYDTADLPGYTDKMGESVHFQFESRPLWDYSAADAWENTGRNAQYLELESGPLPDANGNDTNPRAGTIFSHDGVLKFNAIIEPGAFANDAAARDWMETDTYRQLKDMMLSLTYNG